MIPSDRKPSLTVENYLKAVLQISQRSESKWISTGQLAEAMHVSPGTVTSMLKTLSAGELAVYKPYSGVSLTASGQKLALRILRRHRLIELFLVQTLKLTWDQVHAEAENLEHAVSDELIDRIDAFLGQPAVDPHGDPIPAADGAMRGSLDAVVPLSECVAGTRLRFVRVTNQNPEFLRYLSDSGFEIGIEGRVVENNAEAGTITTKVSRRTIAMARAAAEALLVEPLPPGKS